MERAIFPYCLWMLLADRKPSVPTCAYSALRRVSWTAGQQVDHWELNKAVRARGPATATRSRQTKSCKRTQSHFLQTSAAIITASSWKQTSEGKISQEVDASPPPPHPAASSAQSPKGCSYGKSSWRRRSHQRTRNRFTFSPLYSKRTPDSSRWETISFPAFITRQRPRWLWYTPVFPRRRRSLHHPVARFIDLCSQFTACMD